MNQPRPLVDYSDPRPESKIGRVRTALMYLIEQHRNDGALPTSVRFLFYELVMQRIVAKEGNRPDKIVSEALTDLRESGLVPWDDIVDETREVFDYSGSPTVAEDCLIYLGSARLDPWRGHVPFILTESRSLAGVLRAQCRDYRCRITPSNGQCGGHLHTRVAPLLREGDRVGYLGDLDLVGDDIEANTRRVLESLVGKLNWQGRDIWAGPSVVRRIDGKSTRLNAPHANGTQSLTQAVIARWPHDEFGIHLGALGEV